MSKEEKAYRGFFLEFCDVRHYDGDNTLELLQSKGYICAGVSYRVHNQDGQRCKG